MVVLLFVGGCKQTEDKKQIKACFNQYKQAAIESDGAKAIQCIDSKTIEFYDSIMYYIINYDSNKIVALPFLEKVTVLTSKFLINNDSLIQFNGRKLFEHSVDIGLISKETIIHLQIDTIVIDKSFAIAYISTRNKKTGIYLTFYKNDGDWKLNLSELFSKLSGTLQQIFIETYEDENTALLNTLEDEYGKK
ncbi:hypothetical protein CAP35_06815 [Chitinophagaceae bacterium IBVUCB1]|nr:hypothetical protein CAP35_06815 [Chitinophagaceae bacterium IBVUCB1]